MGIDSLCANTLKLGAIYLKLRYRRPRSDQETQQTYRDYVPMSALICNSAIGALHDSTKHWYFGGRKILCSGGLSLV